MEDLFDKSVWKDHIRYDFDFLDSKGLVVVPDKCAEGRPWVWRAEFFGAFSQVDVALLEKGWHIAYFKVSNMYGCPEAIEKMNRFQEYIEEKFNLSRKAVIFGFSRGALYACNYAAKYPQKVKLLYLDAPVLDILSWPGGKGNGKGAEMEWLECLNVYGLNEATVKDFRGNPIDKVEAIATSNIPVIIVAGDSDATVPHTENTVVFEKRFREFSENIKVILKPGIDHHPHSLEESAPIIDFILEY
jgi:hypothetical protein